MDGTPKNSEEERRSAEQEAFKMCFSPSAFVVAYSWMVFWYVISCSIRPLTEGYATREPSEMSRSHLQKNTTELGSRLPGTRPEFLDFPENR